MEVFGQFDGTLGRENVGTRSPTRQPSQCTSLQTLRPTWGPLGALRQAITNVGNHLAVAEALGASPNAEIRLEIARDQLRSIHALADEIAAVVEDARKEMR